MSISQITVSIRRVLGKGLIDDLAAIGIDLYTKATGRSPSIGQSRGIFGGRSLVDDPIEVLSFMVPGEVEDQVVSYIISKAQLEYPGRGSVHVEDVEILHDGNIQCVNKVQTDGLSVVGTTLRELTGICCIVQRGQGDAIARVALDLGAGVPSLTFGTGLGVRDKMGLLRITIPAEKELVWLTTADSDTDIVLNGMIDVGKLDQPGKGFIYTYPVKQGYLNKQVTQRDMHAAASIEQIISAIDKLTGSLDWRRHLALDEVHEDRAFLTGLVDFTLICDEGSGDELVAVAMAAGAAGASLAKVRQFRPDDGTGRVSHARENCYMVVGEVFVPTIFGALDKFGAFTDKYHGQVITRKTDKGFTYLPPK